MDNKLELVKTHIERMLEDYKKQDARLVAYGQWSASARLCSEMAALHDVLAIIEKVDAEA